MPYVAKRKKIYEEEFLLTEEDGTVVHTLHVALDADSIAKKLYEKQIAVLEAMHVLENLKDTTPDAYGDKLKELGNIVIDLLETVFGKEDTKTILEFYDSRYIEMCQELKPFIMDVVIPQVRKIAQNNKKQVLKSYNRKQRVSLFAGRDRS